MNNLTNIIKAVIYIRVSTEEQVRHGYSLQAQRERLIAYCKEKGYQVVDIYVDEGKTARSKLKNRTELLRLVDDAKERKFDRIIFWKLDRWFRNISDYYKIQEILETNKVDWECSDEDYNTTTSNGRLHLNIKLSIAQNESDQTSDRIKFNFKNMVQNGRAITGSHAVPLGYKVSGEEHNKKVVKDSETEDIAIDMLNYIRKSGTIRQTLLYINKKYDLKICYDSMRHYLMNTKYYGHYRGIDNYCEPYITKEAFEEIQSLVKRNIKMNKRYDYIFSGLLKCPNCGCKLSGFVAKNTRSHGKKVDFKYPSYRCNHAYNDKLCTYKKRPTEKVIEQYLLCNIEDIMKKKILNCKKENIIPPSKKEIDIDKIHQRLARLTDLYLDGRIMLDKYNQEFDKLNSLIKENQSQDAFNKVEIKPLEEFFESKALTIYNKLNNKSKRMFWAKYIDFIERDIDDDFHVYLK